jgi:REP element-mobilizing transposase RayT
VGRPARYKLPGVPQLITQKGHNRLPCFLDGGDYSIFKEILWKSAEVADCEIHAALMLPSAYWVLASPSDTDGISRLIQRTGRCYVRYCNEKYRREGTLWAGRYKACLVEPGQELMQRCASFLLETPAKNGVIDSEGKWPWCFLQYEHDADVGACSDSSYTDISTTLNMGLVLGSEEFRDEVALREGIRTVPGVRGRPRKSDYTRLQLEP